MGSSSHPKSYVSAAPKSGGRFWGQKGHALAFTQAFTAMFFAPSASSIYSSLSGKVDEDPYGKVTES